METKNLINNINNFFQVKYHLSTLKENLKLDMNTIPKYNSFIINNKQQQIDTLNNNEIYHIKINNITYSFIFINNLTFKNITNLKQHIYIVTNLETENILNKILNKTNNNINIDDIIDINCLKVNCRKINNMIVYPIYESISTSTNKVNQSSDLITKLFHNVTEKNIIGFEYNIGIQNIGLISEKRYYKYTL